MIITELGTKGRTLPLVPSLLGTFGRFNLSVNTETVIDHLRVIDLLLEQFTKRPIIVNFLMAILKQSQEIELEIDQFKFLLDIDTSSGVQLDRIGKIIGEQRNYLNDDEYRLRLIVRTALNKSYGEPETLILAIKTLTKADRVYYYEMRNANCCLIIKTSFPIPSDLLQSIERIALAGVKINLGFSNAEKLFCFDIEDGYPSPENGAGFAEVNHPEIGGSFVECKT